MARIRGESGPRFTFDAHRSRFCELSSRQQYESKPVSGRASKKEQVLFCFGGFGLPARPSRFTVYAATYI